MYYVDRYTNEIVKEKDNYAAPERYYEYRKGVDGIIIETYIVAYNPNKFIDFDYEVNKDRELVSRERYHLFKEHNVVQPVLYAYTVPPRWYDEVIARAS